MVGNSRGMGEEEEYEDLGVEDTERDDESDDREDWSEEEDFD